MRRNVLRISRHNSPSPTGRTLAQRGITCGSFNPCSFVVGRRDIDGYLCAAFGCGFRNDTHDGIFMFGTEETVANFTGLAGCGGWEWGVVGGGVGFDGAERVALRGGEGDVARGV